MKRKLLGGAAVAAVLMAWAVPVSAAVPGIPPYYEAPSEFGNAPPQGRDRRLPHRP